MISKPNFFRVSHGKSKTMDLNQVSNATCCERTWKAIYKMLTDKRLEGLVMGIFVFGEVGLDVFGLEGLEGS